MVKLLRRILPLRKKKYFKLFFPLRRNGLQDTFSLICVVNLVFLNVNSSSITESLLNSVFFKEIRKCWPNFTMVVYEKKIFESIHKYQYI